MNARARLSLSSVSGPFEVEHYRSLFDRLPVPSRLSRVSLESSFLSVPWSNHDNKEMSPRSGREGQAPTPARFATMCTALVTPFAEQLHC